MGRNCHNGAAREEKGNLEMRKEIVAAAALWCGAVWGWADVNGLLGTAYRADIVGPEVWTAQAHGHATRGTADSYWRNEVPFALNPKPSPGLAGVLHVVHQTAVKDALRVRVREIGEGKSAELEWVPVRNRWTPAHMTTYYRCIPQRVSDSECTWVGDSALKETKAIDGGNCFVAEAVLKNTGRVERTYELTLEIAEAFGGGCGARVWEFATTSMCKETKRKCSVAAGADWGEGAVKRVVVKPHSSFRFRYGIGFGAGTPEETGKKFAAALGKADFFEANEAEFNGWFAENAPRLETGNIDLLRMYCYRWFVVKRNTHDARRVVADHEYPRTAVYESPVGAWFNCVIGLPVPVQVQEMTWQRNPAAAAAHLRNWSENVRGYDGYIQYTGMSAARFLRVHPDAELARDLAPALKKDALKRSGGDAGKLPVQRGSWGTGAEYQPNFYQYTEPAWDYRHDLQFGPKKGFTIAKLVRLDTAAFGIGNLLGAAEVAESVGDAEGAKELRAVAEGQRRIILERHWDEGMGMFLAAEPEGYRLADKAPCYDSFAPYLWGMIGGGKHDAAFGRLTDEEWFWDDFPVATVAKFCPMYNGSNGIIFPPAASPTNRLPKGCCWNGPTWHYANTMIAEAFGQAARRDAKRRGEWLEFFARWNESHYLYGDRTALHAAEHFRPEDGARCGAAWDYFHSAWIDPFVRYWCGVEPGEGEGEVRFEPFSREEFRLCGVRIRGKEYNFTQRRVGGELKAEVEAMNRGAR